MNIFNFFMWCKLLGRDFILYNYIMKIYKFLFFVCVCIICIINNIDLQLDLFYYLVFFYFGERVIISFMNLIIMLYYLLNIL